MVLLEILAIFSSVVLVIILVAVTIIGIVMMRKKKEVVMDEPIQTITKQIMPEPVQEPVKEIVVEPNHSPQTNATLTEDPNIKSADFHVNSSMVNDSVRRTSGDTQSSKEKDRQEFEKALKKYPKRLRNHYRKLYDDYSNGNILKIENNQERER